MQKTFGLALVCGILLLPGAQLSAQAAAWDAPAFLSPGHNDDIGAYYFSPGTSSWGIDGIWRQSGNANLDLHVGFVRTPNFNIISGQTNDKTLLLLGVDFGHSFTSAAPLDLGWNFGAGISTSTGVTFLRLPVGVPIGVHFGQADFMIKPYIYPRAVLAVLALNNRTSSDFSGAVDVGVDFEIGRQFVVRYSQTFSSQSNGYEAWGIGGGLRIPRRVMAR
jgi:hypothetical protein